MTGRVWATWMYRMMGLAMDGGCAEEMAIYLIAGTVVGRERGREGTNERTKQGKFTRQKKRLSTNELTGQLITACLHQG